MEICNNVQQQLISLGELIEQQQSGSSEDKTVFEEACKSLKDLAEKVQDKEVISLFEKDIMIIKQKCEKIELQESLEKAWIQLAATLKDLVKYVKDQDERIQKLEKDITKTADEQKELKIEQKELKIEMKKMKETLALGQVAWIFEQTVAKHVLPKGTKIPKLGAYDQMIKWLYNKKMRRAKDRVIARGKWQALKNKVNWKQNHWEVLKSIKQLRYGFAHPKDVNLEEAKEQAKDYLSDDKIQYCVDIIHIIEIVR